jgi:hypothetical protein
METRRDVAKVKKEVISHVLQGAVWAVAMVVGYAVWGYIKVQVKL